MKRIIIVGGDLAAGKTTFALKLATDLKIVVLNKDTLKEILGDNIGFKNREENLRLSITTFELFKYLATELMKKEINFILESNFREHELRYLEAITKEYNYQAISFVFHGEIPTLHQRFMARIASATRNKVHQAVDLSDLAAFTNLITTSREVNYFGNIYQVDATNFNFAYHDIIKFINSLDNNWSLSKRQWLLFFLEKGKKDDIIRLLKRGYKMKKYQEQIEKFVPNSEQERNDKALILEAIETFHDNILTREARMAHLTASGLILNHDFTKILMVYHNIYQSWAWTGGHVDGEHDLYEVALREAQEETGITNFTAFSKDIISLEILTVYGHLKNGVYISRHLHLNVTYVFIADEKDKTRIKADENSGVMWIKEKELEKFCTEPEMIDVYRKIIKSALAIKKEREILWKN